MIRLISAAMIEAAITPERIREVAYRLWLERGCPEGNPEHDWYQAEALLRQQTTAPELPPYGLKLNR